MTVTVRRERPGEEAAISALVEAAFREQPHSDGREADIVRALRGAGELSLSLVAVNMDEAVVGHVAFSPVTISDGSEGWFGLGPISVIPLRQRAGIGALLIRTGLETLRDDGARGCVLLGAPQYYRRFGFEHDSGLRYPGPPPEYFQRLVLSGEAPRGVVAYAPAFG